VTLLNLLTIGGPAFLITLGKKPAREPSRIGYLRDIGGFALATGLIVGLAGLVIYLVSALALGDSVKTQKTLLLSTLILLGLANLLRVMAHDEPRSWGNRWAWWWALLAVPVYALVMYLPPTAWFFALTPLTLAQWGLVLLVAVPAFVLCKLSDRVV
jgi:magnesium-transporting ATPase (P-type)